MRSAAKPAHRMNQEGRVRSRGCKYLNGAEIHRIGSLRRLLTWTDLSFLPCQCTDSRSPLTTSYRILFDWGSSGDALLRTCRCYVCTR